LKARAFPFCVEMRGRLTPVCLAASLTFSRPIGSQGLCTASITSMSEQKTSEDQTSLSNNQSVRKVVTSVSVYAVDAGHACFSLEKELLC
jgi:hypothetical protein